MELLLSRTEIRRRMCATVGVSPSAIAQGPAIDQFNQYISEGYEETKAIRRWVRAEVTIRTQVGAGQNTIPFPTNVGPEGIVSMSWWDDRRAGPGIYVPIVRRRIALIQRDDPLVTPLVPPLPGPPPWDHPSYPNPWLDREFRGMPYQYDPGLNGVINIWPRTDRPYEIIMKAYPNPEFVLDTDISVVDAMCIVYWASGCYFDFTQDTFLANKQQQKFAARVKTLHAWQSTGQTISIDAAANFNDDCPTGLLRYDFNVRGEYPVGPP